MTSSDTFTRRPCRRKPGGIKGKINTPRCCHQSKPTGWSHILYRNNEGSGSWEVVSREQLTCILQCIDRVGYPLWCLPIKSELMSCWYSNFLPQQYKLGTQPSRTTKRLQTGQSVTLDFDKNSVVTLDYGREVAGYPYFEISNVKGPVQIEVKYTEQFDGLNHVWADGPYYFTNGLSNSFRVETFNITKPGKLESYFVQGGQRWQSIKVLTKGHITLTEVGFVPTIDHINPDNLPSTFSCSNPTYNEIWKLGANAVAAACFDANSQPSTWEITEEGAYIRGQKPGPGVNGMDWTDYTMTFSSKIVRGGTG